MNALHSKEQTDRCVDGGFRIMEIDHCFCSDELGRRAMKRPDVGKKIVLVYFFKKKSLQGRKPGSAGFGRVQDLFF